MADPQLRQGPNTFSIESDGTVGAQSTPQLGAPTAQAAPIAPGLSAAAPGVSDVDAKTFRAITDLASGALAPKIKEAAQDQYMKGVQQAMTGESLNEIIKDKPWYTDIFAPSAALTGARTYTAQKAIADWAGKMQEQMPLLAKQGPEQLQQAATGVLQGFMTGDAATDALITNQVVEHMAPLFKEHAKEHYIYVQKQATEAQIGAWESLGKVYQGFAAAAASGKGTVSPDDLNAAKARFLASVTPFADQSDESFERNVTAFIEGSATRGNFQVVRLFKDTGLYDKIPPDRRAQLDRAVKVAARDTLNQATPQFALDIATLVNDMTQDPRGIPDKIAALNAKAAAITGVQEADLIPPTAVDNIVGRVMVAQQHEAEARARAAQSAAEKDAEKLGEVATAASQLQKGPGYLDACLAVGLCKEHAAETAGALAFQAAKTPHDRAAVLNARATKAFDAVKTIYTTTLNMPEYTPSAGERAQEYAAMSDSVKPLYFDEHQRVFMDRFNQLVRAGTDPAAAWVASKVAPILRENAVRQDSKDPLAKAIRDEVEKQNESWYYVNNVDDASMRMAQALTMQSAKLDALSSPPDVAAKRAYAQARASGLDFQGKHAVFNSDPQAMPLFRAIGESVKGTAEAFEEVMAEKAKAQGVKLDDYIIVRPRTGGAPHYQVNGTDTDTGRTFQWTIDAAEVKAHVEARVRKQMAPSPVPANPVPVTAPGGEPLGPILPP